MESILRKIPAKSFDAAVAAVGIGKAFALPIRTGLFSWQVYFTVAPATFNITLEVSMDNIHWVIIATVTEASALLLNNANPVASNAFVRAQVNAIAAGGSGMTVEFLAVSDS